jgi:hypothetical protein
MKLNSTLEWARMALVCVLLAPAAVSAQPPRPKPALLPEPAE